MEASEAAVVEPEPKVARATEYVILESTGDDSGPWAVRERVKATSQTAAIRQAYAGMETDEGATLAAVPASSWQPKSVSVEQRPQIKLA